MADLTWSDVLWISAVATVGFTLLSYWWSGVMVRRDWSWQVRQTKAQKKAKATKRPARR